MEPKSTRTSEPVARRPGGVARIALVALALLLCAAPLSLAAAPLPVVAAENFYGDVARQIGGASVTVRSILSDPNQDPHLFEASPSVARALAGARIVVYSGIGYDPWMTSLLASTPSSTRRVLVVADLAGKKPGDNPHLWFDPNTMLAFAKAFASQLEALDPSAAAGDQRRLQAFDTSMQPVLAKVAAMRARFAGTPVTATEPVADYLLGDLGLVVRNDAFQLAVMNATEPSASSVAAFESDLKDHRVKMLVYNSQASDPLAERMRTVATTAGVPVVGVTETEPAGKTYQQWMMGVLDAIDTALGGTRP